MNLKSLENLPLLFLKETKIKITNYKELFYYAIYQSMLFGFC